MVQKKLSHKLGIQADHVKNEKGAHNPKSSLPQLPDSKNMGAELKKKMKKSRSIKRSDIQQPGKPPPPLDIEYSSPIPKKKSQSPIKAPNYMKSTSSFEARKERSSSTGPKTPSPKKDKSARTLNRPSSLKLTKSSSFKLVRKYSPVALCEDLDVQRSTCSSTLKDSKFPKYLELDHGATEAEGTSAMRVCPYTYCSLNGHHHKPLTPLKCFLSSKRRALKTQKSVKLGCLSPRRPKNYGEKGIVSDKAQVQEVDLDNLLITPVMLQEHNEFFVEIYTQRIHMEATSEDAKREVTEPSDDSPLLENDIETNLEQESDAEMDITNNFLEQEQSKEATDETESPPRRQLSDSDSEASDMEWEAGEYSEPYLHDVPNMESGEIVTTCFNEIMTDDLLQESFDEESVGSEAWFGDGEPELDRCEETTATSEDLSVVLEDTNEIPKMSVQLQVDEVKCTGNLEVEALIYHVEENESPPNDYWCSFAENQDCDSSDDIQQSFLEENLPAEDHIDEIEKKEELNDLDLFVGIQDTDALECSSEAYQVQHITSEEGDGTHIGAIYEESESKQTTSDEGFLDEIENHASDQQYQNNNVVENEVRYMISEECNEAQIAVIYGESESNQNASDEGLLDEIENHASDQQYQNNNVDQNEVQHITNEEGDETQIGAIYEENESNQTASDEGLSDEIENHASSQQYENNNVVENEVQHIISEENAETQIAAIYKESETNQTASNEILLDGIENHATNQQDQNNNVVETEVEHIITEETDETQIAVIYVEGESNQTASSGKDLLDEIENHASDQKFQNNNVVENESQYKENECEAEKFKKSDSTEPEDQTCLTLRSAENRNHDSEKMDVEYTSKSDEEEIDSIAKDKFNSEKRKSFNIKRNSTEDSLDTCKFPKFPIGRTKLAEESDEEREFNPRDPNFLPLELDPEGEKVDLRHQTMDERKNAEEWMLDYALRRAVTDLAPARKRRVSLLVAAFETVIPVPKYEPRRRHSSAAFSNSWPIQACR